MALTGETGELTEIFQWMSEEDSRSAASHPEHSQAIREELADVLMYLVRLADVLGVDLNAAVEQKLKLNGEKYPVSKAHGTSKKYAGFDSSAVRTTPAMGHRLTTSTASAVLPGNRKSPFRKGRGASRNPLPA